MIKRILALLAAAVVPVTAQVDLAFTDFKQHLQTDIDQTQYTGGLVFVRLQDGNIYIVGCAGQPSSFIITPNIFCPLGTTGFIAQGDVGNNLTGEAGPDGVPDDGSFWSVSTIVQAVLVEPFQLDRVRIIAAPPSGISASLRATNGDVKSVFSLYDASAVVWYNFLNFPVEEFQVTLITLDRTYGVIPALTNQWVNLALETMSGDVLPDPADVLPNPPAPDPDNPDPILDPFHASDIPVGDPLLRVDTLYSGVPPFDFAISVTEVERIATIPFYMEDELERHYFDVPWGAYLFEFPALDDPDREVVLGVSLLTSPDIYPGRAHVPQGWRMVNEEWADRALEVDPRVFYDFQWFGIDFTNAVVSDDIYLSMHANQWVDLSGLTNRTLYVPDFAEVMPNPDPFLDPINWIPDIPVGAPMYRDDVIVFPPFPIQTPVGDREPFLLGVYDGHYELGPFFFRPGDSATGRLDFRRNLGAGNATRDTSRRFLEFDIRFVDTYDGFSFFSAPLIENGFPLGTRTSERLPEDDFDGDGYSNLFEFAFETDVADANSFPTFAFDMDTDLGSGLTCTGMITKRPNVGNSLVYQFEYSSDLVTWTPIVDGNPMWEVIEDDTILMVTNIDPIAGPNCYLRITVREGQY